MKAPRSRPITELVALAVLGFSLTTATATEQPLIGDGWFMQDCAPYDGAATRIIFAGTAGGRKNILVNAPIEGITGTYRITTQGSRPGEATLTICDRGRCTAAIEGSIEVVGKKDGRLQGKGEVDLGAKRRERFSFDVPLVQNVVVCG